ncbi:cytochrome C biogenesis protein CcmF [Sphingomonas sp. Leaf412]|uniref:heme lyase CcmF/NrfE family subunit n=1 Tax=Sphingomonas sp. Leaf412 TaxID=1736370 RepID=UPI0006F5BFB9|nr:heme lyase CcmF/NrfE family subunit [Sphingomonas sp. Leaf412]KQT34824.1 cytochrome C biogenesis protein CcmF [Sphingomonas sp. Leaf412]
MIAELGLAALWLAAALAALQLALAFVAQRRGEAVAAARAVAIVQGAMAGVAMLALIACFWNSDMSVALVAANSHSMKPAIYKLAGAWGNHEGSMLLWVTILGLAGAGVARFERRLPDATLVATLGAQAGIALGFYAFLLFASNPFARLNPAPPDGAGLNPLLQDPGLAFHPPTLYAGYVGLSVAFSFAVGALVTRDVGPAFARAMRPWVLAAWVFLTLGITAGSYWAYYELGWGGWWFWDPVENASLMPWLAATALLHSVSVLATRDGLRAWTIMLAVVAFSMSMLGTFLVRSGILTSVHAFAVDPSRGSFILALLVLYIGAALTLFAVRIGSVRQGAPFDPLSREGALVTNNLLLTVILGIVLIGTFYPIVAGAFDVQLSVGPPFFDSTAGPVALLLVAIMAVGPLMRWRREEADAVLTRMTWPIAATLAAGAGVFVLAGPINPLPLAGIALAAGLAVASVAPLARRNLARTPLFVWGMVVAHLGIAVSLAGMAVSTAFTRETMVAVGTGQPARVAGFGVTLDGVRPVIGDNWTALEARLSVTPDGDAPFVLRPQVRYFNNPVTATNESAIATLPSGQLYTVLGALGDDGRWQVRLWWKPWVTLIWLGGAMIAVGGLLSLLGHAARARRQRGRRLEA